MLLSDKQLPSWVNSNTLVRLETRILSKMLAELSGRVEALVDKEESKFKKDNADNCDPSKTAPYVDEVDSILLKDRSDTPEPTDPKSKGDKELPVRAWP